tara:strand:+ start:1847 stop:2524 length:678 start_codon:yes stop_codon:yes gene_type:complete
MINKILKFQSKLNMKFKNKDLLIKSLTHKSYSSINNYEKLEFLGDRVLGLIISKKLLELFPDEKEGILDKKLASLVNKNICFEIGNNLNLDKYVLIGSSKKDMNTALKKIISDCIEAIIGAIYLDKGFEQAEKFILKNWKNYIDSSYDIEVDPKTRLQEFSLKKFKSLPIYKTISNTGPRHNPMFKVIVKLKDNKFSNGLGSSKKKAEQVAAKKLLKIIDNELAR